MLTLLQLLWSRLEHSDIACLHHLEKLNIKCINVIVQIVDAFHQLFARDILISEFGIDRSKTICDRALQIAALLLTEVPFD